MSIVTDNTKTLVNALARIEALESENAHLLKVIKERKVIAWARKDICGNDDIELAAGVKLSVGEFKPLYFISVEYDAAGILITPEVKIEQ